MKCEKVFRATEELVRLLGIEPGRVRLEWISSAEGTKFAEVAAEFTGEIEALGPLRIRQAA